jgi:hypothetical protein
LVFDGPERDPMEGTLFYELARLREAERDLGRALMATPPGRLLNWLAARLALGILHLLQRLRILPPA